MDENVNSLKRGPKGSAGLPGFTGLMGETGKKGSKGEPGETGPAYALLLNLIAERMNESHLEIFFDI